MATTQFEVPSGAVDGFNTVFTVSRPYAPGSTAVFINGQLKRSDFTDGWFETNPTSGIITLKEAPLSWEVVQVFYTDTTTGEVEQVVSAIHGRVRARAGVRGRVIALRLRGSVRASADVEGAVRGHVEVLGELVEGASIRGFLRECNDS